MKQHSSQHSKNLLSYHDIYINEVVDCRPGERVLLLGKCTGKIHIDDFSRTDVILRHKSNATVLVSGVATVNIYCFESAWVNVNARRGANVICHRLGTGYVFSSHFDESTISLSKHPNFLLIQLKIL